MHLFLTSSPTGCPYLGGPVVEGLDNANGFVDALLELWPEQPPLGLLVAADPDGFASNDEMREYFRSCFAEAGMEFSDFVVIDRRNSEDFAELLGQAGFVLFAGGHLPTANAFVMEELGAAELIQQFDGIAVGISAGTMNCADEVYMQPEEPGEAIDPDYQRWLPGLGLTSINVSPHFECTYKLKIDGLRLVEDILLPDSFHRPLLILPDGSYVYSHGGEEWLFGEAWLAADGKIEKICENGETLNITD